VREHRALGAAGGAGGVEQRGEVVRSAIGDDAGIRLRIAEIAEIAAASRIERPQPCAVRVGDRGERIRFRRVAQQQPRLRVGDGRNTAPAATVAPYSASASGVFATCTATRSPGITPQARSAAAARWIMARKAGPSTTLPSAPPSARIRKAPERCASGANRRS
jgi:hypothetical protein